MEKFSLIIIKDHTHMKDLYIQKKESTGEDEDKKCLSYFFYFINKIHINNIDAQLFLE